MSSRLFSMSFVLLGAAFGAGCGSSTSAPGASTNALTAKGMETETTVSGRVTLVGDTTNVAFPITGEVSVDDVTYEDGSATNVGKQTITVEGPEPIDFSIAIPNVDPKARYVVQVHIDTDGDGKISVGDFITQESFPVLNNYPSTVDVTAQRY